MQVDCVPVEVTKIFRWDLKSVCRLYKSYKDYGQRKVDIKRVEKIYQGNYYCQTKQTFWQKERITS